MKIDKVKWEDVPDNIKTFMVMTIPSMATLPHREDVANALMQFVADAYTAGYNQAKRESIKQPKPSQDIEDQTLDSTFSRK